MEFDLFGNAVVSTLNDNLLCEAPILTGNLSSWTFSSPHDEAKHNGFVACDMYYIDSTISNFQSIPMSEVTTPQDSCSSGDEKNEISKTSHYETNRSWKKGSVVERRREQNRAAQRAYRQRKEDALKDLETQLNDMTDKHDALLSLCESQRREIAQLQTQMGNMVIDLQNVLQLTVASLRTPKTTDSFKKSNETSTSSNLADQDPRGVPDATAIEDNSISTRRASG